MIGQIYRGRSAPSWRPRCTSVERLGPVWDLSPRTNPHGSFSFMTYLVGITLTSSGLQCKTNCRSLTLPASTIGPKRLCMGPGLWHRTYRHPFHHLFEEHVARCVQPPWDYSCISSRLPPPLPPSLHRLYPLAPLGCYACALCPMQ